MIRLSFLLSIFITILFVTPVFATDFKVAPQKIYPGSSIYPAKRLVENIWEKHTRSKTKFYAQLVEVRLSELFHVAKKKDLNEIQKASERFSFALGRYSSDISKLQSQDKEEAKTTFSSYLPVLGELRDLYPANSAYWLLLQQNMDTIKILSDQLSQ